MRWVLYLPLVVILGLFATSNPQEVEVSLWPLDTVLIAPLGMAMLAFGAFAFLVGAILVWSSDFKYRRRAKHLGDSARILEAELASLRKREAESRAGTALVAAPAAGRG